MKLNGIVLFSSFNIQMSSGQEILYISILLLRELLKNLISLTKRIPYWRKVKCQFENFKDLRQHLLCCFRLLESLGVLLFNYYSVPPLELN